MSLSFSAVLQDLVNKDYDELLFMAKSSMKKIEPICEVVDKENDGVMVLVSILLSSVAADGNLTALEMKFLCDLTGLEPDDIDKMTDGYIEQMDTLVDMFADSLSSDLKAEFVLLVAAICACDETITREENEFITTILA